MKKLLQFTLLSLPLLFSTYTYAEDTWGIFIGQDGKYEITNQNAEFKPQVFIPIETSPNSLLFVDLRSYINIKEQSGVNLAFGHRSKINKDLGWGVNGAVDLHNSKTGTWLPQGSLGLEFFSNNIDLAMNFYAPLAGEVDVAGTGVQPYARLNNNNLEILWRDPARETTLLGTDLNVRFRLPITQGINFLLSGGVFYYFGNSYTPSVYGYQAQAELSMALNMFGLDSNLAIGGGVRQDNRNQKPSAYVSVGVSIGIGGKNAKNGKGVDQGMHQGVQRNGTPIVAHKSEGSEVQVANGTTVVNGHEYAKVFNYGASDDIVQAIQNAGNDTLVVLNGDGGVIHVTQGVQVQAGQTILGEGTALVVKGPGGRTAVLLVGGSKATVSNSNNSADTFTLSTNSVLQNVNVQGGKNGVYIINADNAKIIGVKISSSSQNGSLITNSTNVTIKDATINSVGQNGVSITGSTGVTVQNTAISSTGASGVKVNSSGNVVIKDSSITNTGSHGVEANSTTSLTVNNTSISNINGDGVNATNVGNLTVSNSTINNTNGSGVVANSSINSSVTVTNSNITNADQNGIRVSSTGLFNKIDTWVDHVYLGGNLSSNINYDGNGDLTISNVTTANGIGIIAVTNPSGHINISKVTLNSVGNNFGIYANGGNVTISEATIKASGSVGIYVLNAENVTVQSSDVSGSDIGVEVFNSSNVMVAQSIFATWDKGIAIDQSDSIVISDNVISGLGFLFDQGIGINNSNTADISNNVIDNAFDALNIKGSVQISGDNNSGTNNMYDCYVSLSTNVIIGINGNFCIN